MTHPAPNSGSSSPLNSVDAAQSDATPSNAAPANAEGTSHVAREGVAKEKMEKSQEELTEFIQHFTKVDWVLWGLLLFSGIYGLAIIPFRAVLLLNHTTLYTVLTGSGLGMLSLGAHFPERTGFLVLMAVVAALSSIKFLPLFYVIGRRWGRDYIDLSFMGNPPRWYRKFEHLFNKYLYLWLVACYIPFSPLPIPIFVVLAGVEKASPWRVFGLVMACATAIKGGYAYLGVHYGEGVRSVLETADRYVTWITMALIAWMFVQIWWKNKKKTPKA